MKDMRAIFAGLLLPAVLAGYAFCGVIFSEDFESGSLPAGWSYSDTTQDWTVSSGAGEGGDYGLVLALPSSNTAFDSTAAWSEYFSVEPGGLLRVSAYVKTDQVTASSAKYTASIELTGLHTYEILGEGTETAGGFIYLEKTVRVGTDSDSLRICLRGYGGAGNVYFDDITVETFSLPSNLDAGLYGRWRFDGDFSDSGPYGMTLNSIGSGGSPVIVLGGFTGDCARFDNSVTGAPQVLYPGPIDIKDIDGVTVTAWVKPTSMLDGFSLVSPHTIARLYMSTSADDVLDFRIRDSKLDIYYKRPVANNFTSFQLPLDEWSFVAFTQSGTELVIYFNDHKQSFTTEAGSNYNRIVIGAASINVARGINGFLDELRLYDRALSEEEIRFIRGNGDINRDHAVNYLDMAKLEDQSVSRFTGAAFGDINDDGAVDDADLVIMAGQWLELFQD